VLVTGSDVSGHGGIFQAVSRFPGLLIIFTLFLFHAAGILPETASLSYFCKPLDNKEPQAGTIIMQDLLAAQVIDSGLLHESVF
jgi:hypothetical protein